MRSISGGCRRKYRHPKSYEGIVDMLLLDSHPPGDRQIGALGIPHSWKIDRKIVKSVYVPVIIAAVDLIMLSMSIRTVRPAGVDSKTKTDKDDGSHTKDLQKVKRFVARAKSRQ
jgi:phosphoribosylanthranilate isomerase